MRLFVAADLGEAARAAVAAEQQRMLEALGPAARLTWVKAGRVHLTLVFLGNVDDSRASAVVDAIGRDIETSPFEIVLEGVGAFPERGAPRVLWVGIGKGAGEVIALQRTVVDRVTALGLPLEDRVFHPHLTLARWKESRPGDRDRALRGAPRGPIARARVDGATLYQSRLSPAGPIYTPLSRATLKVGGTK